MFELPREVKDSLEDYKHSLKENQKGKIAADRFKGIRVPWGIYSHRGGAVYMTRIRIPSGLVTPAQLRALVSASRKFGDGILHLTTRQDIQIHDVKIEDTVKVMEYLKEYNLSPRGGGGNTVRNIMSCVLAGLCPHEVFDVRRYAVSLTEYLLRQDSSFSLPRKFKITFSGCGKDCAGCLVNDLGFAAQYQGEQKGFRVFVGGGMGAESRVGKLLEEFIPEDDLGYCVQAVKNVFYKRGDRRNKRHNRLRFLIGDIGLEEFKKLYQEEWQDLKEKEYIVLRKVDFTGEQKEDGQIPQVDDGEFKEFLKYNIYPQKRKGFSSVELRIPRGDISSEELSALADLEKDFPGIEFRTSQDQNIFICRVRNSDVYNLFLKIKEILNDFLYPETLLDVVACKGALTCNLGLCNSPGLAKAIEKVIKEEFIGKKVFKKLGIRLNGCPNACGQHIIGNLSFYGLAKRVDNRPVPFYKFLLGGRKEAENTRLAEGVGIIPAKNIPDFLREFSRRTEQIIIEGKRDIHEFLGNGAKDMALSILKDFSYVPAYSEDKNFYIDWGKTEEFSLAGLGPGECGAGVLDMIESDLTEAKLALEEAQNADYSLSQIKKVLFFSARALLIVRGSDPKGEEEAFSDFKEKFVEKGIVSETYANIEDVFATLKEELNPEQRKEKFLYAKELLGHIHQLYKSMDSSFNFPRQKETVREAGTNFLDLKGTPCPLNYVKAKLALENLKSGDVLEILLDEGEPMDNVPKSMKDDGHRILEIEKQDRFYRVVVKKGH